MSADSLLILIVGLVGGYCLGYGQCWLFARKLEHHHVTLAAWAETDVQAKRQPALILHTDFDRESAR